MNDAIKLKDLLIDIFSARGEVSELQIFGKIAEDKADQYSDVDIRIISEDPGLTQTELLDTISKISPIRETFVLASDANTFAEMVMLEDYTPYQKVDIGVCRNGYGLEFSTTTIVYKNPKASGNDSDCKEVSTEKTCLYNLNNFLFGVPRMTKCFFRKDFDMYRRWMGTTNALISLIQESYLGWQDISDLKGLNAPNAKLLFESLSTSDKTRLESILPLHGKLEIPKSFINNLIWFIELSEEKAKSQEVTPNKSFNKYITDFAKAEVAKL